MCDTKKSNYQYSILTKEIALNKKELNANDTPKEFSVRLKLKLVSNNGTIDKVAITIKYKGSIINTINASSGGEISCFLKNIYPDTYNIEVSSSEYNTKKIELILKENSSFEELEVILDKK